MTLNDFVVGLRGVNSAFNRLRKELKKNYAEPTTFDKLESVEGQFLRSYIDSKRVNLPGYADPNLTANEVQVGQNQHKIACIKAYRERTGAGLADAKRICEEYFERYGYKFGSYNYNPPA